ncbi:glycosyltransferase family 61 protein [Kordiimonas aestuarii]|uniref:glycosyltransferase family 61 protein n=1 Tax=Kordiimonas aestuarii TaxID=1005925 RepID=UPI0021D26AB2|nr:glycosyltransferase family 61 protein [Kordiimonas aestuarii]
MTLLPITVLPCANDKAFTACCKKRGLVFDAYGPAAEAKQSPAARANAALPLLDTPYTNNWLAQYYKRQARGANRIGLMHTGGVWLTDDWGLVLDKTTGFAITGLSGFGWTADQFDYMARQGHLKRTQDDVLALESKGLRRVQLPGTSALLSFPGAYTYGHWITDICARLELLAARQDINGIDRFFLPKVSAWMFPFLAAYGVRQDRIIELDKKQLFELDDLIIPTTLGQHHRGALPTRFAAQMYHRLASISAHWGRLPNWGEKRPRIPLALVKHTALTSAPGREIRNFDEVAALVEDLGGRVLDPLKLPLPAFLNRLRESDLVIGQDSSALHNLAMAPADLLVIQTEPRFNMLHASIQEATGKRVGFMEAQPLEGGGWQVNIRRLKTLIRRAGESQQHVSQR